MKHLGCASCGGGSGTPSWLTAPIQEVAQYSPVLALARAWRAPFAPFVLNCRATFIDEDTTVLPNVSLENGQGRLSQISVVDRLVFQVDQPEAFDGNIFQAQSAHYFALQSGIEATINVDGAPRYAVAPFFTPLATLMDMVATFPWPMGWILTSTQTIQMEFQAVDPLPSLPTRITASYRMWQPYGTDEFVNMTNGQAWAELRRIFADDPDALKSFDLAQSAPVGR